MENFPQRDEKYAQDTREILQGIARKVQACDLLASTLQAVDFELFRQATAALNKAAHEDIDKLGMTAVG